VGSAQKQGLQLLAFVFRLWSAVACCRFGLLSFLFLFLLHFLSPKSDLIQSGALDEMAYPRPFGHFSTPLKPPIL
jgi:hypothetical protein